MSIEKLQALLGNTTLNNPVRESDDKISTKAKEQLISITELMQKTNYNEYYQSTNNSIQ